MSQTITLNIPDSVFQPLKRVAEAARRPLEDLLLSALQLSLPPLEGLPEGVKENLEQLESLDDQALSLVMSEQVPAFKQQSISKLLAAQQERELAEDERQRLDALQREADLVMLRKARAAVLLRLRGKRIPTVAELAQLR